MFTCPHCGTDINTSINILNKAFA
ncbi:transposase [Enterococcus faecium]|nr:transposase [Enterococcus faecium]